MLFCDGCGVRQPQPVQMPQEIRTLARIIIRHSDVFSVVILFIATALTIYPLFTGDFGTWWASGDAAYVAFSVFITQNYPNVGWFPYWYGGFPFYLTYPPLFIYSVSFLHAVSGLSIGNSYRILEAVAYSTTPPALYLIAKFLTKQNLPSFFAGLAYSFVPTFLFFLPYSPDYTPTHIGALTIAGQGPHIFGLTLVFFALLQLLRYIDKPSWFGCMATSILIASVALTNLVGILALAFFMIIAVSTEAIYKNDVAILAFLLSAAIALGLIAFQYDLEFIQSSVYYSVATTTGLSHSVLLFPTLIFGIFLVRRFLNRYLAVRPNLKVWIFVSLWVALLGVIVMASAWFGLEIFPQAERFIPEFDAGVSLLTGLILTKVDRASLGWKGVAGVSFPSPRKVWVLAALLLLLAVNIAFLLPLSLSATEPTPHLSDVPEFQIASWLSHHVTDETVFASGSIAFSLNAFSNVRQIRGGSDHGPTNTWWAAVAYQILKGSDPGISVLWSEAWNVKYIVVTFRNGSNYQLDYSYPQKFENLLPLRFYFGGYGIYEVLLTQPHLVEAISTESAESLTPITNILDIRNLAAYDYLTQVDPNSTATVTYTSPNPNLFQIAVSGATVDTAILVKTTFDPGWVAEVNGEPVETARIGPDFVVAYPRAEGDYQLTFHLEPSVGQTIGLYGTIATVMLLIAMSVDRLNRRARVAKARSITFGQSKHLARKFSIALDRKAV